MFTVSCSHPFSLQAIRIYYSGDDVIIAPCLTLTQCCCLSENIFRQAATSSSHIQGEMVARGEAVCCGIDTGQRRDKDKDTQRKVIHTPSLQRAWTSCPTVREKKSVGVHCQSDPKGFTQPTILTSHVTIDNDI